MKTVVARQTSLRRPGRDPLVVGHRGASAAVPENTLPAFATSWATGARWVEADTQPTADGVPLILHDATLDRTTTGTGPVRARTTAQLADVRILESPQEPVPTLPQLLSLLTRERNLLLEIKGEHSVGEISQVLRNCEASGHAERVFLQSFEVTVLQQLRHLAPVRDVGLLVEELDEDPLARCAALGAVAYNPDYRVVLERPEVVAPLRAAGVAVAVWTCDEPAGWEALTVAGVDAIITNTPGDLVAWQASRAPTADADQSAEHRAAAEDARRVEPRGHLDQPAPHRG